MRSRYPQAFGIDALTDQWRFCRAYAFPPVQVILRSLRRFRAEDVLVVAVIP